MKEALTEQIMTDAKAMVLEITDAKVDEKVAAAQVTMSEMLETQMQDQSVEMKRHVREEMLKIRTEMDKIMNVMIPEALKKIDETLEQARRQQEVELNNCLTYVNEKMKAFSDRVDYFAEDVAITQRKFKRLVSDQDIFKARVDKV